jgi:ABC-type multidrug transport system ATPase subunit
VLSPSGGDAIVGGESIRSPGGMAEIQASMGVCPQFDVLWSELTGHEHMVIFGNMKGLPDRATVHSEAAKLLKEVCPPVLRPDACSL